MSTYNEGIEAAAVRLEARANEIERRGRSGDAQHEESWEADKGASKISVLREMADTIRLMKEKP